MATKTENSWDKKEKNDEKSGLKPLIEYISGICYLIGKLISYMGMYGSDKEFSQSMSQLLCTLQ